MSRKQKPKSLNIGYYFIKHSNQLQIFTTTSNIPLQDFQLSLTSICHNFHTKEMDCALCISATNNSANELFKFLMFFTTS